MMTTEIIILPVICNRRTGVDLARQDRSHIGDSRNVMVLRRARLNRLFDRLNRLLEDDGRRALSKAPCGPGRVLRRASVEKNNTASSSSLAARPLVMIPSVGLTYTVRSRLRGYLLIRGEADGNAATR
jgi:hypothetical protein